MRKGLILIGVLSLFFLSSCTTMVVEDNEVPPVDQKKILSETDKYRADLEAGIYTCKKTTRYIDFENKRTQVISYFTDEEQIKKMNLIIQGENDRKYIEYVFLNNDVLLYVSETETVITSPPDQQTSREQKSFMNEYYFSSNALIYWLQQHEKRSLSLYESKSREIFSGLEYILNELSKSPQGSIE